MVDNFVPVWLIIIVLVFIIIYLLPNHGAMLAFKVFLVTCVLLYAAELYAVTDILKNMIVVVGNCDSCGGKSPFCGCKADGYVESKSNNGGVNSSNTAGISGSSKTPLEQYLKVDKDYLEGEDYFDADKREHYNDKCDITFDKYADKGYMPGYHDVNLYSKDGAKPFSDLLREPTPLDIIKYGGQCRADRHADHLNQALQDKPQLSLIYQSLRKTQEPYNDFDELDYNNESREWWSSIDQAYNYNGGQ